MRLITIFILLALLVGGAMAAQTKINSSSQVDYTYGIHGLKNGTAAQDGVTYSQLLALNTASGLYYPVVSVGSNASNDYVTDGIADEVQLEQAWASIDNTGGTILITSLLTCSRYVYINNTKELNGVPFTIMGMGYHTGITVPASNVGLMIKNPSMFISPSNCITNLKISAPPSGTLGTTGIDFNGSEVDTNVIDVFITRFNLGIDSSSPSAYDCVFSRCNTYGCANGIFVKGQQNLIDHCITGYSIPAGANTGYGIKSQAETSGNIISNCDTGGSNKGVWLYSGYGNQVVNVWHDNGQGESVIIEGSATNTVRGGYHPIGANISLISGSSYNSIIDFNQFYGRPDIYISADSYYNNIRVTLSYPVGDSSYVHDSSGYTAWERTLIAPAGVSPTGNYDGRQGMVIWAGGATGGAAPGWVCTSTGTAATATWKAMSNLVA